jgi:hypothetical protein
MKPGGETHSWVLFPRIRVIAISIPGASRHHVALQHRTPGAALQCVNAATHKSLMQTGFWIAASRSNGGCHLFSGLARAVQSSTRPCENVSLGDAGSRRRPRIDQSACHGVAGQPVIIRSPAASSRITPPPAAAPRSSSPPRPTSCIASGRPRRASGRADGCECGRRSRTRAACCG